MAALRMLIAVLLVAAAAPGDGGRLAPEAPAARPDAFSLELNYWGNPMISWRVGSDGKGEYRLAAQAPSGRFQDYDVSTRRFDAGPAGFERVHTILDDVARRAPPELPCHDQVTDMPYGQVNWHRGSAMAGLGFNLGCRDDLAQQIMARLREATALVESWASSQPVAEVSHVRGGTSPGPS